jgi:GDPmannose 4,6-dehydratase
MWLMLQQETPEDYVVATGKTYSVQNFLEASLISAGLEPDLKRYVEYDQNLKRPAEVDLLVGDATKARVKLGWEPKLDFHKLVDLMVQNDLALESQKVNC